MTSLGKNAGSHLHWGWTCNAFAWHSGSLRSCPDHSSSLHLAKPSQDHNAAYYQPHVPQVFALVEDISKHAPFPAEVIKLIMIKKWCMKVDTPGAAMDCTGKSASDCSSTSRLIEVAQGTDYFHDPNLGTAFFGGMAMTPCHGTQHAGQPIDQAPPVAGTFIHFIIWQPTKIPGRHDAGFCRLGWTLFPKIHWQ